MAGQVDVSWTWSPLVIAVIALALAMYARAWRRVGGGRAATGVPLWRVAAFGAGLLALVAALLSPIARLGEQMFLWHMTQHILLVDIAPILLIAGFSEALLRRLPVFSDRLAGVRRWLARPVTAVLLYAGTLWIWHLPALYNLALSNPLVHALQHATLLGVGLVFWWHIFAPTPAHRSIRGPSVFSFMAVTKFSTGVLASLLTFLPERGFVYDFYVDQPRMWGLTAGADQQLGGAIMVTEELVLLTAAFGFMFVRMLSQADREDEELERLEGPNGPLAEAAPPAR